MGKLKRLKDKYLDFPVCRLARIVTHGQKSYVCMVCGVYGPRHEWRTHRCGKVSDNG